MKLFIGGIAPDFDEVDVREMFELYGEVRSASVIKDRETGKSKGFGFIEMPNNNEAIEAMRLLDGVSIMRKTISVKEAGEQPPRDGGANRFNNNSGGGNRRY